MHGVSNSRDTASSLSSRWSSRFHFILAATGAAVGLGNIWKFPYMAGNNGGGAFVFLYLFFVVLIGLPLMMGEILIGRCGRGNPVSSLHRLSIENACSLKWQGVGWLGTVTLLLVLSFYSVVAGWSLMYLVYAAFGHLQGLTPSGVVNLWQLFQSSPWQLLVCHTLFMGMTMGVVACGVRSGLERAATWMMPALLFILLGLVAYALTTPKFYEGVRFLLGFKWHKVTVHAAIDALGHAFFSLAIGAGCMLVYGAYLPERVKISGAVVVIATLNLMIALLTGIAIFPLVFTYHLPAQAGPGLMFETLPIVFAQLRAGHLIGSLFFVLLIFAAWTSSISLAEPLVILCQERLAVSRKTAAIGVGCIAWCLGLGSLLSFNVWSGYRMLGRWTVFDFITELSTNVLLPLGGLFLAFFSGYKMTQNSAAILGLSPWMYRVWRILIRLLVPIAIMGILITSMVL